MSPPPLPGEQPYPICVIPHKAVPYQDGMLLATDTGEFGGQLAFRDRHGKTTILLNKNPKAVLPLEHTYVFTGLRHMSGNEGNIYRVVGAPNEIPRAVLVAKLNGAPQAIDKSGTVIAFSTSVFHGRGEYGRPLFRTLCYKFTPPSRVDEVECGTGAPPNSSSKPTPLRGAA